MPRPPRSKRRRVHLWPPAAPAPLRPLPRDPAPVALEAFAVALVGQVGGVVALVVDPDGHLFEVCSSDADPDTETRCARLLEIYAGTPARAVLFGEFRSGAADGPGPDDTARLERLRALGEAFGIVVLDWLVVISGTATSVAELGEP